MLTITRMLIVDSCSLSQKGIKETLNEEPTFKVVGETTCGEKAIDQALTIQPDVILMEYDLQPKNGLEVMRIIKKQSPQIQVIMMTHSPDIVHLFEVIKHGAQGYLLKNVGYHLWVPYIKSMISSEACVNKTVACQMFKAFISHQYMCKDKDDRLSDRERDILILVAQGLTNKEISGQLYITENTVKNHLKNLFQKLHLTNRVQLAKYAYEHGYLKPSLF